MLRIEWQRKRIERFNELLWWELQRDPCESADQRGRMELERAKRFYAGYRTRQVQRGRTAPETKLIERVLAQLDEDLPKRLVTEEETIWVKAGRKGGLSDRSEER